MAGRFPLYTDADIHGPLVEALIQRGWDVLRAVDRFRQATDDPRHFDEAVRQGRVLVSNDSDMKVLAEERLDEGGSFPGLVWWPRKHYTRMSVSDIVEGLEELAQEDDPFGTYPIIHIKPRH